METIDKNLTKLQKIFNLLERIEYISLINIRPAQGNRSMEIQDASLRDAIKTIILKYLL